MSRATRFPSYGDQIQAPQQHAVYVIRLPDGRVLYIGRANQGQQGLRGRLQEHLRGATPINGLDDSTNTRRCCQYQWLLILDAASALSWSTLQRPASVGVLHTRSNRPGERS